MVTMKMELAEIYRSDLQSECNVFRLFIIMILTFHLITSIMFYDKCYILNNKPKIPDPILTWEYVKGS